MPKEKPVLKIKISGPGVKPGRIPIPLLLRICREAQTAINRQAEALEGRRSKKPDTFTEPVVRECTLELIALRKGSTTLDFAPATSQPSFPELASMGSEAVTAVAATLQDTNRKRGRWKPPDPGVLDALDDLGSVFDEGVNRLRWIVPAHNRIKTRIAEFLPTTRPKIRQRKQESFPLASPPSIPPLQGGAPSGVPLESAFLEGMLELADGKCRISPPIGPPATITFGADKAENIIEAIHKPVRVKTDPSGRKLMDIEIAPVPQGLDSGTFFAENSIAQLIAAQAIHPITNLEVLAGAIPDEDVDEMVAQIYRDREARE